MILWIYLIGTVPAWVVAMYWYVEELPGGVSRADVGAWVMGSMAGLLAAALWPAIVIALVPIAAVKWLHAKKEAERHEGRRHAR